MCVGVIVLVWGACRVVCWHVGSGGVLGVWGVYGYVYQIEWLMIHPLHREVNLFDNCD